MMKRCIACGAPLWQSPLLTLEHMPASAQDIPDQAHLEADKGRRLDLCQCSGCGLVQFDCEPVEYYRDVIRSGGSSSTMAALRRYQYKNLIENYHLEGKKFIEVGCGQGEFLSMLQEFSVEIHGIEHKPELVELAREKGLNVTRGFTEEEDTRFPDAPYDVFLSFNFLEHQPRPNVMLQAIYRNLTDQGMGLVTVPSLEYIMEHDGYYELIRDHLAYYTFDTLQLLMERNGFQVLEWEVLNRDTLSLIVKKKPRADAKSLENSLFSINREVNDFIDQLAAWKKTIAIWGAGHQGFTLASTTKLGKKIRYIIDSATFKQGKFAPASHLPIVSPDYFASHPVDVILIVAPGYTDEIAGIIKERFGRNVEVLALKTNHIEKIW